MALNTIVADVLHNLDILAEITNHQTLLVNGDRLDYDQRYFQSLRRSLSGDSRHNVLKVIHRTFDKFQEIIESYQSQTYSSSYHIRSRREEKDLMDNIVDNIQSLIQREQKVIQGLQILSTFSRYDKDPSFRIKIDRLKKKIHNLCKKGQSLIKKDTQLLLKDLHRPLIASPVISSFDKNNNNKTSESPMGNLELNEQTILIDTLNTEVKQA